MSKSLVRIALAITWISWSGAVAAQQRSQETAQDPSRAVRDQAVVEALLRLPDVGQDEIQRWMPAIRRHTERRRGTLEFVDLVERFQLTGQTDALLKLASQQADSTEGVRAVAALLKRKQQLEIAKALAEDDERALALIQAVGSTRSPQSTELLSPLVQDMSKTRAMRSAAVRGLAKTNTGRKELLRLAQKKQVPKDQLFAVANALLGSSNKIIRAEAAKMFELPPAKGVASVPPISELVKRRGRLDHGREIFQTKGTCAKCHKVMGKGKEVGPDLSEIGSKLSREAIYVSILDPSAGISHNYETHQVITDAGKVFSGLLMSRTDQSVTIRNAEGLDAKIPTSEIDEIKKQNLSLMPADLQKNISIQELVDVVEYVSMLRKKDAAGFHAAVGGQNDKPLKRTPEEAVAAMDTAQGLETHLFAAEPMMRSPSNIDVDHRGRVWVCEVVNYRHFRNTTNPPREDGDRIVVLEDSDGDGKADKSTVFYQGRDIDSAHGICVLGDRVYVSANDKVFILGDRDGDLKADTKKVLFSGIGGVQHDHGIHAFVFGPDGKLYFNFGNEGRQLLDSGGRPIKDMAGNLVNDQRRPYQQGMAFRCNLDGSQLETIGWNFRNNWELCVDSFGTIWQSDNDDDGNRATRINYVMENGNFGYRDERTGAGWRESRIGMHNEIPLRHWHLKDPGVVPNVLQTGAGSPTGIVFYEGYLLPKPYRNQLIHCDAGPNIVRQYTLKVDRAGYRAEILPVLHGARDNWFRPSDVCVAPDGSLIVADWYDPGVGGHRMGDIQRGRLFRIVPEGHQGYEAPPLDTSTVQGCLQALRSPNQDARYQAWTALHKMGQQAEPGLKRLFENAKNPRIRARALWLLGAVPDRAEFFAKTAIADENANIRVTGVRLARRHKIPIHRFASSLTAEKSAMVRREAALSLRGDKSDEAVRLWADLAGKHRGDRWYLEALGIGAEGNWNACFDAWLKAVDGKWNTPAGRDIVWRARTDAAAALLGNIIVSPNTSRSEMERCFRALEFHDEGARRAALAQVLKRMRKKTPGAD